MVIALLNRRSLRDIVIEGCHTVKCGARKCSFLVGGERFVASAKTCEAIGGDISRAKLAGYGCSTESCICSRKSKCQLERRYNAGKSQSRTAERMSSDIDLVIWMLCFAGMNYCKNNVHVLGPYLLDAFVDLKMPCKSVSSSLTGFHDSGPRCGRYSKVDLQGGCCIPQSF